MLNQNKILILVIGLLLLVVGYLVLSNLAIEDNPEVVELNEEPESAIELEPTFSWRFEEADTNNPDGNPQTNVYLTANYEEGDSVEKLVDTIDGGCSELEGESHEGDISNTGKVQCYYAGLGQRYRIIELNSSYAVERKLFEESLPDYTPPDSPWEVVVDFEKRY